MKLSQVIKIWESIHIKDIGTLTFGELCDAIESVDGLENDIYLQYSKPSTEAHHTD